MQQVNGRGWMSLSGCGASGSFGVGDVDVNVDVDVDVVGGEFGVEFNLLVLLR